MKKILVLVFMLLCVSGCSLISLSNSFDKIERIGWSSRVRQDLRNLWDWSLEENREEVICLYGMFSLNARAIVVTRTESADEGLLTENTATIKGCPKADDFVGIAHTHPNGTTYMSPADERAINDNGFDLMTIICGENCRTTYKRGSSYPIEQIRP